MKKNYTIIAAFLIILVGTVWYLSYGGKPKLVRNVEMFYDGEGLSVMAEEVFYLEGVSGFYARPEESGTYPGVVMIHEWWGLNENIKDMALELAKHGYRVLAVDLHGEVAETPDDARRLVSALNQEEALNNMMAAADFLREEGALKVASLGWCFGGGQSLQLALSGEELAATVIYYGQLTSDENRLSTLSWPVLGIFGDQDQSVPVSSVNAFRSALDNLRIKNEIHIYPGVGHAFANPSGMNYAPEETMDAWQKTLKFLEENLK
jgi:carboxymethylenebutenolidase